MKKYFLHNGTEQQGPFDLEELKQKNVTKETPIWFDGLDSWTSAGEVDELKGIFINTPPPFPPVMPPPIPELAVIPEEIISETKRSSKAGRNILIGLAVIFLALAGFFVFNQIQHQQYQINREVSANMEEDEKTTIRNNITSYVTATRSTYSYSELGGISGLKISVANSTDYLLDNVKVKVIYVKANGEVWDSRIIDFDLLNPQSKSTIEVPDTQRGTSVQYEIASIKSAALGMD